MIVGVAEAAALLRRGGVVAYPTETFYGLGALALRPDALARLVGAKGRPGDKPLPLIAADVAQVSAVASLDDPAALALAARFWPGPLTLVLPATAHLDATITGGGGTVGIRVPGAAMARELARLSGGPLVSTSANLSGERPVTSATALSPDLVARIDGVVDGGPTPGGLPSTVVAVAGGTIRLVRDGAVAWPDIEAAVADLQSD